MKKNKNIIFGCLILSIVSLLVICNIYSNILQTKKDDNSQEKGSIIIGKTFTDIMQEPKYESLDLR